jgi:EAL domain-containing protein (putative c-di-GMP-specific phosphodiesterase class I)
LASWRASGISCRAVSVNISARQLHDPRLVETVASVLAANTLPPGSLILEMTESVMLKDLDQALGRLSELKALGVLIAVDDFGTGYCSFDYLRRLPLDVLKIDRSFTKDIETDTNSAVLVDLMNQLAHTFGLVSVVEGVEFSDQLETARLLSCDQAQGFLLARPAPAEDISQLLEERALASLADRLETSPGG